MIRHTPPVHRLRGPSVRRSPMPVRLAPAVRLRPSPLANRLATAEAHAAGPVADIRPNPYGAFVCDYTAEGGIALTYKDLDPSLLRTLLRGFAWFVAMGVTADLLGRSGWSVWSIAVLAGIGVGLWLLIFRPVEVTRRIEIRPDCMIVDNGQVFWRQFMESWPAFARTEEPARRSCRGPMEPGTSSISPSAASTSWTARPSCSTVT